ncbi:MAG: TetR/AcrR family transcriptional regulator [bacterium]
MNRKKIQEQRMKEYFIQATREILRSEGLKNASVRNIAEKAGYSYATLYNYFKDAKDLVFECVRDFQQECREFIESETRETNAGIEKIRAINLAYVKYFVQYPGIFELFYIEKTSDLAHKQPTVEMINDFLDKITEKDWQVAIAQQKIEKEGAGLVQTQIKFFIIGVLVSYINRRLNADYREIMAMVDKQLNYILEL